MLISVEETGKNRLQPGQKSMENAPVLSNCTLIINPWGKPAGVLEHCLEGQTSYWYSLFRGISFWPHPKDDEECSLYFYLFTLTIPINYKANSRKILKLLRINTYEFNNPFWVGFSLKYSLLKTWHCLSLPLYVCK